MAGGLVLSPGQEFTFTRVVTLFSIWVRLASSSLFSLRSCVLSWRSALTSAVIAATLAVRVLMVSAGVSASGFDAAEQHPSPTTLICFTGTGFQGDEHQHQQHAAGQQG